MAPIIPVAISLIAELAPELLRLFNQNKAADVATQVGEIAKTVTGASTVDDAAKMIKENPEAALQFKKMVLDQQVTLENLAFEKEKIYVADVADARKYRDDKTFWLGVAILLIFAISVILVLIGGYNVIVGTVTIDANLYAAVSATLGTLIGYVAASAQSVVNYFFGSSQGSSKKTDELADAIQKSGKR